MPENKKPRIERVAIDCTFGAVTGSKDFLTPDNKDAAGELVDELDKKNRADQSGKLIFELASGKDAQKIEMVAAFRGYACSRVFTTIHNNEAVNMLANKLSRKKIASQPGKLVFEFVPEKRAGEFCVCGHRRFAHVYVYSRSFNHGCCDVRGCECRRYTEKPKGHKINP